MKKLTRFSLYMTENCWGSAHNHLTSRWLADAILRGIELGCLTYDELHFGSDQEIWEKLLQDEDPLIQEKMKMVLNAQHYFSLVHPRDAEMMIKTKFRGIDPWVVSGNGIIRLTDVDPKIAKEFSQLKQILENGWPVRMIYGYAPMKEPIFHERNYKSFLFLKSCFYSSSVVGEYIVDLIE